MLPYLRHIATHCIYGTTAKQKTSCYRNSFTVIFVKRFYAHHDALFFILRCEWRRRSVYEAGEYECRANAVWIELILWDFLLAYCQLQSSSKMGNSSESFVSQRKNNHSIFHHSLSFFRGLAWLRGCFEFDLNRLWIARLSTQLSLSACACVCVGVSVCSYASPFIHW